VFFESCWFRIAGQLELGALLFSRGFGVTRFRAELSAHTPEPTPAHTSAHDSLTSLNVLIFHPHSPPLPHTSSTTSSSPHISLEFVYLLQLLDQEVLPKHVSSKSV